MDNFWGKIKEIAPEKKPEEIVKKQFDYIYSETNGIVIGRVEKFNKSFSEMNRLPMYDVVQAMNEFSTPQIQKQLGETKDAGTITYEVYLTAKEIPQYKYRFMFIQHGVAPYPSDIVIENTIAQEIGYESDMACDNEENFCELLKKILSSERVMTIVSQLKTYC
jgi:hypothetical protein